MPDWFTTFSNFTSGKQTLFSSTSSSSQFTPIKKLEFDLSNIAGCAKYLREAKELRSRVCWEHHSAMGALFGIIRQLFCSPCLLASYLDENILPTQSEDQGWQYRQFEAKRCGFEECWKRRAAWEPGFESSFANFLLPPPSMRSVLETSFD